LLINTGFANPPTSADAWIKINEPQIPEDGNYFMIYHSDDAEHFKLYSDGSFINLEIYGKIHPRGNNLFDLGSSSLKWRDLWLSRNANVTGNVTASYFIGDGSQLTGISTYNASYVPYTGASDNVDLGSYNLTTTGRASIGTSASEAPLTILGGESSGLNDVIAIIGGGQALGDGPSIAFNDYWRGSYTDWTIGKIGAVYDGSDEVYEGSLVFYTNNGGNKDTISEKMRITYDGKVGIGTTTPTAELDVNGSINVTGNGNVTASYFIGDGSQLTGISGADYNFTTNNFNGSGSFTTTGLGTFGSLDVDTLNLNGNKISDSSGSISFDNENLVTTGGITAKDLDINVQNARTITIDWDAEEMEQNVFEIVGAGGPNDIYIDQWGDFYIGEELNVSKSVTASSVITNNITTVNNNVTITSAGGSVIIKLG